MLRRTKTLRLQPDPPEDFEGGDVVEQEKPILPQRPSVDEQPLFLERRSGADRRNSQDEVRTEFQRTLAMAQEHHTVPTARGGWSTGTRLRIALVVLAIVAAGAAAWLALQHDPAPVAEVPVAPAAAEAPPPVPTVRVLVAARAIGLGERLSGGAVAWQDWPQTAVSASFITDANTPDALAAMAGNVARAEFVAGEPILADKLVKSDEGYLSAVLGTGMRGVSVSVTADAASGGFIVPNDHVDVVLSRTMPDGTQHTQTVVSNVRVLAIGARLGQSGTTGGEGIDESNPQSQVFSNSAIATLELNPTQSEILANASSSGRLSLVLRALVDSASDSNADETAANEAIRMTSPFWIK